MQDTGGDLGLAYRLLKQAEEAVFPAGPYRLQRTTLNSLGMVAFRMGRLDEALTVFRKLDDLAASKREVALQATAQYNILNTASLKEDLLPTPGGKQRLIALGERALATALAAEKSGPTAKIHRALAEFLANEDSSSATALQHVESCLEIAIRIRVPHDEAVCSSIKASLLRKSDPAKSHAAERQALGATARANSPRTQAYSASRRMRLSWDTKERPEAIRDSLATIDAIEMLRSLQDDAGSSAELFSTWTSDYYFLPAVCSRTARGATSNLRSRLPSACGRERSSIRWDGRGPPRSWRVPSTQSGARSWRRLPRCSAASWIPRSTRASV